MNSIESPRNLVRDRREWQELQQLFEGKFWIGGEDLPVPRRTVLEEGWSQIDVLLGQEHLPPIEWLTPKHLPFFGVATRSRLAQCGLHIHSKIAAIQLALGFNEKKRQALKEGGSFLFSVDICNLSGREVIIPEGCGVFRFYYPWAAEQAWNEQLISLVENPGGIEIEGTQGKDWDYIRIGKNTVALSLRIDPASWKYFPKAADNPPLIVPTGPDYREELDKILVPFSPISPPKEETLWICESQAVVRIPERSVNLLLPSIVKVRPVGERWFLGAPHSSSLLIAGGETDWRLRFEILCDADNRPENVRLEVYQNKEE